jgi:AcrR family transcriptional regulator
VARTRVLDIDKAVATATEMFWRNGYEQTSLADLTTAMGITPPSFYFAFGSKEGLFRRVLDHYRETRISQAEEALKEPTARRVAEVMLRRLVDLYTDPQCPPGCLAVCNSLPCNESQLHSHMAAMREARKGRLRKRFAQAKQSGDLPREADPGELALFVIVTGWGLAFAAQTGAKRKELHAAVTQAMKGWPS